MSRLIVVTGNSRGLGQALSQELLHQGHRVVGCGTSQPPPYQVDVDDQASVAAWSEHVLARHGVPDIVVNNAGVMHATAPLWEISVEEFSRVLNVNVKGTFHVLRCFLPAMVARGSGVVVNFSSGWGRTSSPRVAPYCASKWAIEGMTRALSQELPKTMAAVALDPGTINTQMLRTALGNGARHFPNPQDWSREAAQLILDLGPQHNGQSLSVPKLA